MSTYWDAFIDELGSDVYRLQQDPSGLCEAFYLWLEKKHKSGEKVFG